MRDEGAPLRRLAAGDWVVAVHAASDVSPGLGKLTGGVYDGPNLVEARVEFPGGVRRLHPGDLARVGPELEAEVLEHALEEGLVPEGPRPALEARLGAFRANEVTYVRTPGLLDGLWAAFRATEQPPGLAELFEWGAEDLRRLGWRGTALPPPQPLRKEGADGAAPEDEEPARVPARRPARPQPRAPARALEPRAPAPAAPPPPRPVAQDAEARYVKTLVRRGLPLRHDELRRLSAHDDAQAQDYLRERVSVPDLEAAARFGSALAGRALRLSEAPARALFYRAESADALRDACGARGRVGVVVAHLTLVDLLRMWSREPEGEAVEAALEPTLRAVGGWLRWPSPATAAEVAAWWGRLQPLRFTLQERFPALQTPLIAVLQAQTRLAALCREPETAQDEAILALRVFRQWEPLRRAILAVRAVSAKERQACPRERATLRWVEVRVADALERFLLAGELAGP